MSHFDSLSLQHERRFNIYDKTITHTTPTISGYINMILQIPLPLQIDIHKHIQQFDNHQSENHLKQWFDHALQYLQSGSKIQWHLVIVKTYYNMVGFPHMGRLPVVRIIHTCVCRQVLSVSNYMLHKHCYHNWSQIYFRLNFEGKLKIQFS